MEPYFGHRIRVLHWCADQSMTNALAAMELTAAQGQIMAYLAHQTQPPCPRDVEEAFRLSHPTVSGLLSRLEKKGFIALRPDPADKRCKRIHMLPRGWECHETMHRVLQQHEEALVRGFTAEEKARFFTFLERAIANVRGTEDNHKEERQP